MSRRPPRGRPSRSQRPGASPPVAAVVGLALAALVFIGLVAGAMILQRGQVRIDPVTLCPTSGPAALTAILIDVTDPLSPVQRSAVLVRLNKIVSSLRLNEEITVYSIDPSANPLKSALVVCRPSRPAEVSELTGNKTLAENRFIRIFEPKVKALLDVAMDRPGSERSPIMEAIQAVAVAYFQAADASSSTGPLPKRLVIVSDMLENAAGGSHYRGVPDFMSYKASVAYARVRSHLNGVKVTILYLRRDTRLPVQGRSHVQFWDDWFADQGASVEDVYAIEG